MGAGSVRSAVLVCNVLVGDAIAQLRTLPAGTFRCVVTSPPYWGLRDYGVAGQLGLEVTPEEYVANLVSVFREVRRVLRDDGTVWLNLGDSYASTPPGNTTKGVSAKSTLHGVNSASGAYRETLSQSVQTKRNTVVGGLKPKDLVGIPWRVAFALQADGWWLRSDIIWAKPNPMPESVTDRPTKAHEYIFLLAKSANYYYDVEAIKEPLADANAQRTTARYNTKKRYGVDNGGNGGLDGLASRMRLGTHVNRNRRSVWRSDPATDVWELPTAPFKGAHFAVFPPALVEPCILAGSAKGDSVLDPFVGSGTTLLVARRHQRHAIGIELNTAYAKIAQDRLENEGVSR